MTYLISTMRQTYNGRALKVNDEFEAPEVEALDLVAVNAARINPKPSTVPLPVRSPLMPETPKAPVITRDISADDDGFDEGDTDTPPAASPQSARPSGLQSSTGSTGKDHYNRRDLRAKR